MIRCYTAGVISGGERVGGLVGVNWRSTLIQCYSAGEVRGRNYIGGLVGDNDLESDRLTTGCFWDIETSGQAHSAGGTGKTTAEMQTVTTFIDAGWDFAGEMVNGTEDIWWILEGQDYPRLWWEAAEP